MMISATYFIKNIVGATILPTDNSITGTNISIATIANYQVTMQFNGTLDSGDSVLIELIDTNTNTISSTYISTGENESAITTIFDTTTETE
ncbi:MAG: hypothetical protein WCH65_05885 [bacterium]